MKCTSNVTTVLAILAQKIQRHGFWYPLAFFCALIIGNSYGVGLTNHEFVMRLKDFLDTWDEGEE